MRQDRCVDPLKEAKKSHYRRVYVFRPKRKHWIFIASRECLSISKAQGPPNPFDVLAAVVITLHAHALTKVSGPHRCCRRRHFVVRGHITDRNCTWA